MALLNPGGAIAQFQRNDCSISPVEVIWRGGVRNDVKTVQTNLGHHAPSFTLKTYAHVSDRMQQRSADRMERLIGTVSGTA